MGHSKLARSPIIRDDTDRSVVSSLRRALAILHVITPAERVLAIAENEILCNAARSTAYRLVRASIAESHLIEDPEHRGIAIGFAVGPLLARLLDRNRVPLEALP